MRLKILLNLFENCVDITLGVCYYILTKLNKGLLVKWFKTLPFHGRDAGSNPVQTI